ncbi:MAG: hypothetical protein IT370_25415 [Deltaproteobacteria bacterium]|nr:hypothetical protein [Deltaproteobacteria bacterium]
MSIQFSDDESVREGDVAGNKWLRVKGPSSHPVGARVSLSIIIGGQRYELDGMVVEVTRSDSLLFITRASAGWAARAPSAQP